MKRKFYIFTLILSCFVLGCRAGLLSHLVSAQEWSENYATVDGATCTSPEMIDGNLETVGRTGHEITVTLPTRKSIHRIVIRGTNIEDVIVYMSLGGEGNWKIIKQVKNNREPTIDLRVSVVTDAIRLRVGGTFDDQPMAGAYSAQYDAVINRQVKRGTPTAQEIELYGFAEKDAGKPEKVEQTQEIPAEKPADIGEETPEF